MSLPIGSKRPTQHSIETFNYPPINPKATKKFTQQDANTKSETQSQDTKEIEFAEIGEKGEELGRTVVKIRSLGLGERRKERAEWGVLWLVVARGRVVEGGLATAEAVEAEAEAEAIGNGVSERALGIPWRNCSCSWSCR